jgi:2-oxoglutarate dehydrogenase E1 component
MSESSFSNFGQNAGLVEDLYQSYLLDRSLVPDNWARYFDSISLRTPEVVAAATQEVTRVVPQTVVVTERSVPQVDLSIQQRVCSAIAAYRERGHLVAKLSPLSSSYIPRPESVDLNWDRYGFSNEDMAGEFLCLGLAGKERMRLSEIKATLEAAYTGTSGIEFSHLHREEERLWMQSKCEERVVRGSGLTPDDKLRALEGILYAEHFEEELHKKYIGHKRFSLEGGETLIPMLQYLIKLGSSDGIREAVIGMPHRGRLSVLVNILKKPLIEILNEFEDQSVYSSLGSGDVKYHLGYESTYQSPTGDEVRLSLACNPSHLEIVNPVVEGICRAKQDVTHGKDRVAVLPIVLHGDAACIGQGVVAETINFSQVRGYDTGGTFHIIVNNQIGFTTYADEARSTPYSSEWLKAVQAPVIHVNAEDPEMCCWAVRTAHEFRQKFNRDVALDLYCYRKYGHNEADDPSYTQPLMYSEIKNKKKISEIFSAQLLSQGVTQEDEISRISDRYVADFDSTYSARKKIPASQASALFGKLSVPVTKTSIDLSVVQEVTDCFTQYEPGFTAHPKLIKILEARQDIIKKGEGIDWAFGEALAFGSLMTEGINIRLSGQDCIRGTFSQRHLGLRDYNTGKLFYPLSTLRGGSSVEVYNSVLSELAVMGFEFGYASVANKTLTMWEAQFGDFSNGAQIVIDQFLAASESKWSQLSGLVLLLPHGYEGQGPEHSSARLERYLQLCAEGNMRVCMPTTAAQYFHMLRRQGMLEIKRPLVVMTPKSLLRSPDAASKVGEITGGSFQPILPMGLCEEGKAKGIIFTSGKVSYDLKKGISEAGLKNVEVVRLEEIHPFPAEQIKAFLKDNPKASKFAWAQEEPNNMGAWTFVDRRFRDELKMDLPYFGRPASASTAAGSNKRHQLEQSKLVKEAIEYVKGN